MNSGDLMEEECVRACVRKGGYSRKKRETLLLTAPVLHLNSQIPSKVFILNIFHRHAMIDDSYI